MQVNHRNQEPRAKFFEPCSGKSYEGERGGRHYHYEHHPDRHLDESGLGR